MGLFMRRLCARTCTSFKRRRTPGTPPQVRRSAGPDHRMTHWKVERSFIYSALLQRSGESLTVWRDTLYHEYRIPVYLAALGDLKLPYVEQMNPLLSRKILTVFRCFPDHLRKGKVSVQKDCYKNCKKTSRTRKKE